jgi:hypothetical protein
VHSVKCPPKYQVAFPRIDQNAYLTLPHGNTCATMMGLPCRGVSRGMVFFWCLFSIFMAAATLVVGRRGLEW